MMQYQRNPLLEKLISYYCDYLVKNENGYMLLASSVCVDILSLHYKRWIKDKETVIVPLEDLPEEEKQKYWDLAGKWHKGKPTRLAATQTAYALALMTGK